MKISKEQLLEFVRERDDSDHLARAYDELPEYIDTDDTALLSALGINASELLGEFDGDAPAL